MQCDKIAYINIYLQSYVTIHFFFEGGYSKQLHEGKIWATKRFIGLTFAPGIAFLPLGPRSPRTPRSPFSPFDPSAPLVPCAPWEEGDEQPSHFTLQSWWSLKSLTASPLLPRGPCPPLGPVAPCVGPNRMCTNTLQKEDVTFPFPPPRTYIAATPPTFCPLGPRTPVGPRLPGGPGLPVGPIAPF